jgi:hypothetical protein
MGVAMVLNHQATNATLASVRVSLGKAKVSVMDHAELEALRQNVPAARSLPMLQAIARASQNATLALELFDNQQLLVEVSPAP